LIESIDGASSKFEYFGMDKKSSLELNSKNDN